MPQSNLNRPLAVVTGASTGIGFELARCCAQEGFDLLIAADEPQIETAAQRLRSEGAHVEAVQVDLATTDGVAKLYDALHGRPVDALLANAGRGLGKSFLDQEFDRVKRVIDTNVTGTIELVQRIGRDMKQRGRGRILLTGSIAGFMPGTYQATYSGTKAFIDSFSFALRNELKDSGVTVSCLMPGATETEFFRRADMLDTKLGTMKKDDPAKVAREGFKAMMKGEGDVVSGFKNKLQVMFAHVMPAPWLAAMHRKQAAPGTAEGQRAYVAGASSRALPNRLAAGAIGGMVGGAVVSALTLADRASGRPAASDLVDIQRRAAGQAGYAHRPVGTPPTIVEEVVDHALHLALSAGLGAVYAASTRNKAAPGAATGAGLGLLFYPLAFGLVGPLLGLTENPAHTRSMTLLRRAAVHALFGVVTAMATERAAQQLQRRRRQRVSMPARGRELWTANDFGQQPAAQSPLEGSTRRESTTTLPR